MSNSRINHLPDDGGTAEDDSVAYQPAQESEIEVRPPKSQLSKSREKVSDGAEEKLLLKEKEAKISTRVDMADAKYVVGDHRNGDAKIELDANQKFSGLTREELLKYASDPFWVRLRWVMFALFWLLWLGMLAGAIAIIVRAPKCAPPPPKTWFEKGPLIDMSDAESYEAVLKRLPLAGAAHTSGIFVPGTLAGDTYDVLDEPSKLTEFSELARQAKDYGVKVIVDLIANQVSTAHQWFALSENRSTEYGDYFVWAKGRDFADPAHTVRTPPNNWRSTLNESAWAWSAARGELYLHQYEADRPDLNFGNARVVQHFDRVLTAWMRAGAAGVRLLRARQLLVNESLADEVAAGGRGAALGADHTAYSYYRHRQTSDQPGLADLLQHWAHLVKSQDTTGDDTVFTVHETDSGAPELFLYWKAGAGAGALRPPSVAPLRLDANATLLAYHINKRTGRSWPALQLVGPEGAGEETVALALLLRAAPVFAHRQLASDDNDTVVSESLSRLAALRSDASVEHGDAAVVALPDTSNVTRLLACARWKPGHTGYAVVWNPTSETALADLRTLRSLPATFTVHHVTQAVRAVTNYTHNHPVGNQEVVVPPRSSVMLSYVPQLQD